MAQDEFSKIYKNLLGEVSIKSCADKWKVTFEPTKQMMTISRKRTPSKLNMYFGNCTLDTRDKIEILGVTLDRKLTWSKHIQSVASRAGQRLGALRKVANKLDIKVRAIVYLRHRSAA